MGDSVPIIVGNYIDGNYFVPRCRFIVPQFLLLSPAFLFLFAPVARMYVHTYIRMYVCAYIHMYVNFEKSKGGPFDHPNFSIDSARENFQISKKRRAQNFFFSF